MSRDLFEGAGAETPVEKGAFAIFVAFAAVAVVLMAVIALGILAYAIVFIYSGILEMI